MLYPLLCDFAFGKIFFRIWRETDGDFHYSFQTMKIVLCTCSIHLFDVLENKTLVPSNQDHFQLQFDLFVTFYLIISEVDFKLVSRSQLKLGIALPHS